MTSKVTPETSGTMLKSTYGNHLELQKQVTEFMKNSSIKKEIPDFSQCKQLMEFDRHLPLLEVDNKIDIMPKQFKLKFQLDQFLIRIGLEIINSVSDKEKWDDFISNDLGTILPEKKSLCCYNALKELYRCNYELVVKTYKEMEDKSNPKKPTNKFTSDTLKYLDYFCNNFISIPIYPFVISNTITIYYQIFHLPKFLKTFQSQPQLNDEEKTAYEIFKMTINIVRIYLTYKPFIEIVFVDRNWCYLIDCLINCLENLQPVLHKSNLIEKMAEDIMDVIGVYYTSCKLYGLHDLKIVRQMFSDKKSTKTIKIMSAKVLCYAELCKMSMEYLVDWLDEDMDVDFLFQTKFPHKREISIAVDICYMNTLQKTSAETIIQNPLTNFDYKMLRKYDPINDGVKMFENVVKIFNCNYKQTIMLKIKENIDLSKEDRVAVNCLFMVINKVGCSKDAAKSVVSKMIIFNVDSLLEYLKELYDYITVNIVAMRISEAILYGMCNIVRIFQMPMENSWFLILKKYCHHPNCSMEIKLAAAVAITHLLQNHGIDIAGEIVLYMINILSIMRSSMKDIKENSIFMGFYVPEIIEALRRTIHIWIAKFHLDELRNEETTKKFLIRLHEVILKIYDEPENLQIPEIEFIPNEIMNLFNIRFKHEIINELKNQSELENQEKLSLECLNLAIKSIENFKKNNHLHPILLNEILFQSIFSDLINFNNTSKLVQGICESILHLFCYVVHPSFNSIDPYFWIPRLKECLFKHDLSPKLRLTSSVILGRMCQYIEEFNFDLLIYLLNVLRLTNIDGENSYLDLPCEIIQITVTGMIQNLFNKIGNYFMAENDVKCGMESIQQLLSNIFENKPVQDIFYRISLNNLVIVIMKSFSLEWRKPILNKIENKSMLNERERVAVNCFCNALNVLGQHILDDVENDMICDPCELILGFIKDWSGFIDHGVIATRISEILLYCLCNIYKIDTISEKSQWSPILWTLFTNINVSREIRIGSSVALALVIKAEDKSKHQVEIEKLKLYFENVISSLQDGYLGFSRSEIFKAYGKVNINEYG